MIKQMAWNTFKKTGNIDTFLELKQVNELEENIEINKDLKEEKDGEYKNKWDNYCRK